MNLVAIYIGTVFILLILSLLVMYNFLRYRFKGDKTVVFIAIFSVLFVGTIVTTLSLLVSAGGELQ